MEILLAVTVGVLFATAVYMLLRRSIVKLIIGLSLLGHATNLLIFTIGGVTRGGVPIVGHDVHDLSQFAEPITQALILTAIVIGFGTQAYAIVLVKRVHDVAGTDDFDQIVSTDKV